MSTHHEILDPCGHGVERTEHFERLLKEVIDICEGKTIGIAGYFLRGLCLCVWDCWIFLKGERVLIELWGEEKIRLPKECSLYCQLILKKCEGAPCSNFGSLCGISC